MRCASARKEMMMIGWTAVAVLAMGSAVASIGAAQSAPERVVYALAGGKDGATPTGLTLKSGELFGSTWMTCGCGSADDGGLIFKLNLATGAKSVLYRFKGYSQWNPGPVTLDKDGNVYGVTYGSGTSQVCGTVFRLDTDGTYKTIHSFQAAGGKNGCNPNGRLLLDKQGNLYGNTQDGGANGRGVVFKLTPGGVETVLHAFSGQDGGFPQYSGLIMDSAGNLYGTTSAGGPKNAGVIFKLSPSGVETVLHSFGAKGDGANPGDLVMDQAGNIFGTTYQGGAHEGGTIFRLATVGAAAYKVLFSFGNRDTSAGGYHPTSYLTLSPSGDLYGTTYSGGLGAGILFSITQSGQETVLHTFTGTQDPSRPDGVQPFGPLAIDYRGHLYGTTMRGGAANLGIVYEASP